VPITARKARRARRIDFLNTALYMRIRRRRVADELPYSAAADGILGGVALVAGATGDIHVRCTLRALAGPRTGAAAQRAAAGVVGWLVVGDRRHGISFTFHGW
jgi:hypothetical protein